MHFLCITIWQLLVQQQSKTQNLASSYLKNHIKDTWNADSDTEMAYKKESSFSWWPHVHSFAGKKTEWEVLYPCLLHVFMLQKSHKSF